ncbi:hypothetical protein BKA70DRAFT_1233432 [Coprinopsis sp. MPI-PUGE-AT-0042]|nr:hypothetical protein BKA70DRAFT_1233432 [Coprinopsis sp. MPI-PUGE-AT-0042]
MSEYELPARQTYMYYSKYTKDNRHNMLIVGGLWSIASACGASDGGWDLQLYGVLVVTNFGFGIAFIVLYLVWGGDYGRIREMNKYGSAPAVALAVVAEFLIATCLCIFLKEKETGFTGTRKVVRAIIFYAINRCLLTSLLSEHPGYVQLKTGQQFMPWTIVPGAAPVLLADIPNGTDLYVCRRSGAAEPNIFHPNTLAEDSHAYDLKEGPFPSSFSNSASKLASS